MPAVETTRRESPALEMLAARQWRDYQSRTPGTYFGEPDASLSLEQAYALQAAVAALRHAAGEPVIGYKIGCVGPGVTELFGVSGPIHGRLFASELHASGCTLDHRAYANLAVEAEMAVVIGADGETMAAFPVVELHHFVLRSSPRTLSEVVANNGLQAGIVLAPTASIMPLRHWATARTLSLGVNGRSIDSGPLWALAEGVAAAVDWLRRSLAQEGIRLAPGDLVLTGTPLGLHPVGSGDRISVAIDGQPHVGCAIT